MTKARRWYNTLAIIVLVTFLITACSKSEIEQTTAPTQIPSLSNSGVLLVQDAQQATLDLNDTGAGHLTLEGVDARILYFSDRPNRDIGSMPVQEALDALFDSVLGPPNAALSWIEGGSEHTTVVVLKSGTYDEESATMTYEIQPLSSDSQDSFSSETVGLPSGSLGPVSLFIDSVSQSGISCGPTSYWYLDETSGDYIDSGPYGISLTPTNIDRYANGGAIQGYASCEQENCEIVFNNTHRYTWGLADQWTIEFWLKIPNIPDGEKYIGFSIYDRQLVSSGYFNRCFVVFVMDPSRSNVRFMTSLYNKGINGGDGWHRNFYIPDYFFSDEGWHHIVITYSGTKEYTGCNCYLDGGLVSDTSGGKIYDFTEGTPTPTPTVNQTDTLIMLSPGPDSLGEYSIGIDEFAIYDNCELTRNDVRLRYNAGIAHRD